MQRHFIGLLFVMLLCLSCACEAQSLAGRMKDLSDRYSISFSYDAELLAGIPFTGDTSCADLPACLQALERSSAFYFRSINTGLYVAEPQVEGANLKLSMKLISETGVPISGIELQSRKSAIKKVETRDGWVQLWMRYSEVDTLEVLVDFHTPVKCSVRQLALQHPPQLILKENLTLMQEVVIKGYLSKGVNYKKQSQQIEVDLSKLPALPGQTDADILNALEALPGISSADGKAGSLNIRGSTFDHAYVMYDNIPIYHKGHFFGTLSPYNPLSIDKVQVSRSSYTADKGGRVGGAIELISRTSYRDSASFDFTASATHVGLCWRRPLKKNKVGMMIAGRTSYPIRNNFWKMKAINEFIYQESEVQRANQNPEIDLLNQDYRFVDLNIKIGGDLGKKSHWHVSSLMIGNRIRIGIADRTTGRRSNDNMDLTNDGINATFAHRWNTRSKTTASVTASVFSQNYYSNEFPLRSDSLLFEAAFRNRLTDYALRLDQEITLRPGVSFQAGYEYKQHQALNFSSHSNPVVRDSNETKYLLAQALYGNFLWKIKKRWYHTLGMRLAHNSATGRFYGEPRLSTSYVASRSVTLKAAAGMFNQFLVQVVGLGIENIGGIENSTWQIANKNTIPVIHSTQWSAGILYHPKNDLVIDVEAYYKQIEDISVINFTNFTYAYQYLQMTTQSYGLDVLVKKKFNRLEAWTSYSISKNTMTIDSVAEPSLDWLWHQRHVLDLAAIYELGRWKFSVVWKYRSGLSALVGIRNRMVSGPPGVGAQTNPSGPTFSGATMPLPDEYTGNFPDNHQLDFSAVFTIADNKRWKSSLGLSITNIYSRKNIFMQLRRPQTNPPVVVDKYMMLMAPNLQYNLSF
jgi:hypothetical protein